MTRRCHGGRVRRDLAALRTIEARLAIEWRTPAGPPCDFIGDELNGRGADGQPAQRFMIDAECGEQAESTAQCNDRGEQRPEQQTDIGKHSTSQHAGARSLLTARDTLPGSSRGGFLCADQQGLPTHGIDSNEIS